MDIAALIIFVLPAYIANALPVLVGGGAPLDLGKSFSDGRRLFGEGKTIRGFIGGVFGGTVLGFALYSIYPVTNELFMLPFMLSLGTLTGDATGSFIKRRLGIGRGRSFALDRVFFLVVALLFSYPFLPAFALEPVALAFLLVLTYVLHPLTNFIANRLGLKNVPW